MADLSHDELTVLRRDTIGFIFQQFNLIPLLSVLENVEYPLVLKCKDRSECGMRPFASPRAAGVDDERRTRTGRTSSGGQQQRVAIARALVNDPALLRDEPTGNLDQCTGAGIMELLATMNREGKTIIMVTHDPGIAEFATRQVRLVDGRIREDTG